jgi:hypothetical protein
LIHKFELFLIENNLIPIASETWKAFQNKHTGIWQNDLTTKINEDLLVGLGIYVYDGQGVIYYIGQGKLAKRVVQHYIESYRRKNREKNIKNGICFFHHT